MDGAQNAGWETHKENIQPLCRGRKVSILEHSIETSRNMVDYEQEMEQQIRHYEEKIAKYDGNDPIEPWTEFITFLEQSNLIVAKLKKKLTETVKACIKKFSGDPKYKNDKRMVDLYLKLSRDVPVAQRCGLLKQWRDKGIGVAVPELYLVIADLEESQGKFDEALKTLHQGIKECPQPLEKLKNALEGMEYRTVQRLAEAGKESPDDASERAFGASVPVFGPKKDAPVFRNDLEPSQPMLSVRPQASLRGRVEANKIPIGIFETDSAKKAGTSEINPPESQALVVRSSLADISSKTSIDKENRLDPSAWNKPDAEIEQDAFVAPAVTEAPAKLKLFVEEDPHPVRDTDIRPRAGSAGSIGSMSTVPASTVYNGSCNVATKVNYVALEMCNRFGQIEKRKRELWREKEALRLKSVSLEKLSQELVEHKTKLQEVETKLRESKYMLHEAVSCNSALQGKLKEKEEEFNNFKKSASTELEKLQTDNAELTAEVEAQDSKIRELHTIISNERYQAQQLSTELEEMQKLNEELNTRLEEEKKKAAAANISGPSSVSTLVATTGSVSNASSVGGNGISNEEQCAASSSNNNHASGDEFSFLPNARHAPNTVGNLRRSVAPCGETFNASVRMGTTYFMKEDTQGVVPVPNNENMIPYKVPLKTVENFDDSNFLPPPPLPRKGPTFNLYESCTDSHSTSLFAPMPIAARAMSKPMGPPAPTYAAYAKENIPPATFIVPVSSRQYDLDTKNSIAMGSTVDIDIDVSAIEMDDDEPHAGNGGAINFDLADLTRNLEFNQPLLNSTPERFAVARCAENLNEQRGNFIHTQRFKALVIPEEDVEGPMSPDVLARGSRRTFREEVQSDDNPAMNMSRHPLHLSPIQETSKENRSSCTTGSSSGNMTSTRGGSTSSGASLYNSTRSVSGPRSVSRNYPYNFNN